MAAPKAGKAIGRSGDEGIDSIRNVDLLGLNVISIQAKRWQATIDHREIQKFVGSLQGNRPKEGIFNTTSDISGKAEDYVAKIDPRIVLTDVEELAQLKIDRKGGVTSVTSR